MQQPQTLRQNTGTAKKAAGAGPAAKAAAAKPEAPWGQESLRFSATAAAQSRPATNETMRATASKAAAAPLSARRGSALVPIHEEFDLNNPPDEEKVQFVLPVKDPGAKEIALSIWCMDGRCEKVTASVTWTVRQLLLTMGAKLTLWQVSFFALSETDVNANTPDRWLDPEKTLEQEGLVAGASLVFKIKYFKYPKKLRDPAAVHFFYAQTQAQILHGTMETSETMCFRLAGLQMAIQAQTYRPQDLRKGALTREISKWIPKGHLDEIQGRGLSLQYVERRIYAAYEQVKDMTSADATFAYLKTVKDLPLYGSTIFNVTLNGQPRVLGIAEDGMLLSTDAQQKLQFFTPKGFIVNRPKYEFTSYEDITKITLDKGSVTVVVLSDTDAASYVFQCAPPAALSMVELMCGYRRMLEAYVALSK